MARIPFHSSPLSVARSRRSARVILALCVFTVCFAAFFPQPAHTAAPKYPLVSLYFVDCCFSNEEAKQIAHFDLVIMTMEAQEYNPNGIALLRKLNPSIKIIPYVPSQGIDFNTPSATRKKLINKVQSDWYLVRPDGSKVSRYSGELDMNITKNGFRSALTDFVGTDLNKAACGGVRCWDGVFYDVVEDNLDYLGGLDLDNNGAADSDVNTQWVSAYRELFDLTRSKIGGDKLIIINGVSNESVQGDVNGRMFEDFPTPWHADGSWNGVVENVGTLEKLNMAPAGIILSGQGTEKDYKKMRFTLASGLVTGTYAGYDNGVDRHNSIWVYDEYKVTLGKPQGSAVNLKDRNNTKWKAGVWRRDFEKGIVILNSTQSTQTIQLDSGYERLHGTQDTATNNGTFTGKITLKPNDALILLRRLRQMDDAPYLNGSFAAVFDKNGRRTRTSFFPFVKGYSGNSTIQHLSDNKTTVIADSTYVTVVKNGKRIAKFAPFGRGFRGGLNVTVGKLEVQTAEEKRKGIQKQDRIVVSQKSGGKLLKIYDRRGMVVNEACAPFGSAKGDGISAGIGNVLSKSKGNEIVVGIARGGNGQLHILDKKCKIIHGGFAPYGRKHRSGISVAVGDLNADGKDEIVTMPGAGSSALVRVYRERQSRRFGSPVKSFYAFDKKIRSGGGITISDLDLDGVKEIIPMTYGIFQF